MTTRCRRRRQCAVGSPSAPFPADARSPLCAGADGQRRDWQRNGPRRVAAGRRPTAPSLVYRIAERLSAISEYWGEQACYKLQLSVPCTTTFNIYEVFMSHLFSATRIGQLTLDNRIVIAPMCQYSADEGKATSAPDPSWPTGFLRRRPVNSGGHGGRACGAYLPGDLGLWDDETENALRGVVEDIRAWSPIRLGIQLGHAGRKASCAAPGRRPSAGAQRWWLADRRPFRRGVSRWRSRPR